MKNESKKVTEYLFEKRVTAIKTTFVGNLMMATIILLDGIKNFTEVPQAQFCLYSGLFVLIVFLKYNWKNPDLNWLMAGVYIIGVVLELFIIGFPEPMITMNPNELSKGVGLELMILLIPYIYMGLRAGLVIPLVSMALFSRRM